MSEENVELLREMYRLRSLTEFADSLHPEAELHQARVIPDTDAYYGAPFGSRQGEWHQARPDHLSRLDLPRRHAMALRGVH